MTCINSGCTIFCIASPDCTGRLKLGNKYIWVEFHEYFGPSFYRDYKGTVRYDPVDEKDPIWPLFEVWYEKYKAKKAAVDAKRARLRASTAPCK